MRGLCLTVGTRTTNGRSILHSDPSSRFRVPNVPSQMSPTGVPGSGGVGYGLMNEPNPGWIGIHDLTQAWQWSHSSNSLTPCVPRVAAPPPQCSSHQTCLEHVQMGVPARAMLHPAAEPGTGCWHPHGGGGVPLWLRVGVRTLLSRRSVGHPRWCPVSIYFFGWQSGTSSLHFFFAFDFSILLPYICNLW